MLEMSDTVNKSNKGNISTFRAVESLRSKHMGFASNHDSVDQV